MTSHLKTKAEEENKMEECLKGAKKTAKKEPRFFCGVCLLPFTRSSRAPISLNCGHVFCARCVPQMYKRGEGEENGLEGASKLLLQCGTCRAITFSKEGQMKKCLMLAKLIEKEGDMAETDAEDDEVVKGTLPAPPVNQLPTAENNSSIEELNVFYRYMAIVEVREKIAQALAFTNSVQPSGVELLRFKTDSLERIAKCQKLLRWIEERSIQTDEFTTFIEFINEMAELVSLDLRRMQTIKAQMTVEDLEKFGDELQQQPLNPVGGGDDGEGGGANHRRRPRAPSPGEEEEEESTSNETRDVRRRRRLELEEGADP